MTDPALLSDLDGAVDSSSPTRPTCPTAPASREVADHDPPLALWGGPDGLDVVRGLLVTAARLLRPGGWLGIEHADQQGEPLPALVRAHGAFTDVADHPDLAGRPRFTTARRVLIRLWGRLLPRGRPLRLQPTPTQRAAGLDAAAAAINRGELVLLPTDTVYGVGRRRLHPRRRDRPAGGQGPRPDDARAGARSARRRRSPGWWCNLPPVAAPAGRGVLARAG